MKKKDGAVTDTEMLARLRSRRDFLKIMGAVGVGAAVGPNILLGRPSPRLLPVVV